MIAAAIDIGSNTVKLLVGRAVEGRVEPLLEEIAYTRLGEGIGEGRPLTPEAIARTVEAVVRFAQLARGAGAAETAVVATEAARSATNGDELMQACRSRGVDVRVISGEEEARLSWMGGTAGLPPQPAVVLDVGGGSAEIVAGDGDLVTWSARLPLGAVRLRETFLGEAPARPTAWALLEDHVLATLAEVPPDLPGRLIGVGGTVAQIAQLAHPADPAKPLTLETVASIAATLRRFSRPQILAIGVPWGRDDIIAPGAAVVLAVMRHLGRLELLPARTGLRFGLLRAILAVPARQNP